MNKQNAVDLARTARSEAESITKGDKRTIAAIINNWNECVKQAGFWCIYDFPATGYTRKSQLVADLLRCAGQLDEYVEPNQHAAETVEQQTREFNAALTRVLDVEEAYAEALRIDAEQYAAPVTCSIFQRNDGVQLALDSSCDARFIRTSKNGEWFKAGFRNTDMEGYQPVVSEVLFTSMPSRTLSYSDGVMVVSEA
ncbi:hypothetical protein [Enterobacter cloacae]|uniref:hypothetical protein n=1 Tax=Enterobacter cloacae TaxID=550 RepID=UPI003176F278